MSQPSRTRSHISIIGAFVDDYHTENEVHLYNDLKAVRAELEKQQRRIEQLEMEKQEIVAVMHQAAVSLHYFRELCLYKN